MDATRAEPSKTALKFGQLSVACAEPSKTAEQIEPRASASGANAQPGVGPADTDKPSKTATLPHDAWV
jgi:hypothetical protein